MDIPTPKHVAIDLEGVQKWADGHHVELEVAYEKAFGIVRKLILEQIRMKISVVTFYVMSRGLKGSKQGEVLLEQFAAFIGDDEFKLLMNKEKMKVTVLGKWYDLPQNTVDSIKAIGDDTRDNDSYFVNFCINYDGQEEIVDAVKMIGRQIKMSKLDVDMVTKDILKENLYTSSFVPPDVIIRNGENTILTSLLLWDTVGARIVFTKKLFPDFSSDEFVRVLVR
jgi:undecaprenyl diphosphate synthase